MFGNIDFIPPSISNLLDKNDGVRRLVTEALRWMSSLYSFIAARPVLILMVFVLPLVGFAVGFLKRLKNV